MNINIQTTDVKAVAEGIERSPRQSYATGMWPGNTITFHRQKLNNIGNVFPGEAGSVPANALEERTLEEKAALAERHAPVAIETDWDALVVISTDALKVRAPSLYKVFRFRAGFHLGLILRDLFYKAGIFCLERFVFIREQMQPVFEEINMRSAGEIVPEAGQKRDD
jgi:hypothetical protein